MYQAVEGRHCKACLLEGGFGRAVSGDEGVAWQGVSVGGGLDNIADVSQPVGCCYCYKTVLHCFYFILF